jgi:hypothetical protein
VCAEPSAYPGRVSKATSVATGRSRTAWRLRVCLRGPAMPPRRTLGGHSPLVIVKGTKARRGVEAIDAVEPSKTTAGSAPLDHVRRSLQHQER